MARRRLLKSDFYLSVNGQSATTTGLEFEFTGGTEAVTLIASVPVDFANAELPEWVSFTRTELSRDAYSLTVTAQANQGTSPLTGDIRIKSLDERYTVIIQCNEHGNEAYVSINGQTHVTTSITYDTTSLQFTVSSMGGWEFNNTGSYPLTANPTEVINEGQSETLLYITAGTNSSSSTTKEYTFELVSKVDPSITATVTITQQVMTYLDMQYYNQVYPTRLPYTGVVGDSFSLTANTDVNLITNSPFIELPLNPVPNPDGTRGVPFNALSLTPAYSASSAESYTFSISGISAVDAGVNDAVNVSYEPYPFVNILQQVDIASGTTTTVWGGALNAYVTSNYGLTIVGTSDTACTASINNNNLSITISEASFFDDKDYYITFGTTGSLGSQITNNLHVVRRGHKRSDYITMFPSPTATMDAGEIKDFYAFLFDGLGNVKDGTITSSCTWSSSDTNLLIQTGWDEHGFALFSASTNILVSTSATITAVYSGKSGEYAQEPLSATCVVTISPVIVEKYRNLRFEDSNRQAIITPITLTTPANPVYLAEDLYRGSTLISSGINITINETPYKIFSGTSVLAEFTGDTEGPYQATVGDLVVEYAGTSSSNGYLNIHKGDDAIEFAEYYTIKGYDDRVEDGTNPAILEVVVPADAVGYRDLKFVHGTSGDLPAETTLSLTSGGSVEDYNVFRTRYVGDILSRYEKITTNQTYYLYSGNTQLAQFTTTAAEPGASLYEDSFLTIDYSDPAGDGHDLTFEAHNSTVYTQNYTLITIDNAITTGSTSVVLSIRVVGKEYVDNELDFYDVNTRISTFTNVPADSHSDIQLKLERQTSAGTSTLVTTSAATYTVYSGATATGTPLNTVTITGSAAYIYNGTNYSLRFNGQSIVVQSTTELTEEKVLTVVAQRDRLKSSCIFTFLPTVKTYQMYYIDANSNPTTGTVLQENTDSGYLNVQLDRYLNGTLTSSTIVTENLRFYLLPRTGSAPLTSFTASDLAQGGPIDFSDITSSLHAYLDYNSEEGGLIFEYQNCSDEIPSPEYRLVASSSTYNISSEYNIVFYNVARPLYTITFVVTDEDGQVIPDNPYEPQVFINDELLVNKQYTAYSGDSITYTVTAMGYYEVTSGLTVSGSNTAITVTVHLSADGFVSNFYVKVSNTSANRRPYGNLMVQLGKMNGNTFIPLSKEYDVQEGTIFPNTSAYTGPEPIWIKESDFGPLTAANLTFKVISGVDPRNNDTPYEGLYFFYENLDERYRREYVDNNATWDLDGEDRKRWTAYITVSLNDYRFVFEELKALMGISAFFTGN